MTESIGFIGLGIMGGSMAANLLKAGYDVTVWNRTPGRITPLARAGAAVAASAAAVAASATIIILCVSDTPDVEEIILGPQGVIEGIRAGSLVIDCSTISPTTTQAIAGRLKADGAQMLDAPVSGGSEGAAKGTLSIMVGGDKAELERAMPILRAMGKTITHVGGHGAGQMAKLVNQILVVVTMQGVAEALLLAQAGGLDLEQTLAAVGGGAAGSWMLNNRGPQVIRRDWRPGFTVDLQQKDLRLVLETADQLGIPLPSTALVFQYYRALQQQGLGGEGNHALVKALEQLAGMEITLDGAPSGS
ncbi:MAG: NAD(P)-dependent oxidoreductase [Candidatus Promineofilum sp.]|nr:NAD(P)-dependent oxidoreductase [Promineifilum sp.]